MYWLSHPIIHAHYQHRATQGRRRHWVDLVALDVLEDGMRVASLGCGEGAVERHLLHIRGGLSITGIDRSAERIDTARATIAQDASLPPAVSAALECGRLVYRSEDFDEFLGNRGGFDAIIFNMSLHHSTDPFLTLQLARDALGPDGRLIVNEYVGEPRLQATEQLRSLCGSIHDACHREDDAIAGRTLFWPRIGDVVLADRTEAPASGMIVPALKELFEPRQLVGVSSGLMHHYCSHVDSLSDDEARVLCGVDAGLVDAAFQRPEFVFGIFTPSR